MRAAHGGSTGAAPSHRAMGRRERGGVGRAGRIPAASLLAAALALATSWPGSAQGTPVDAGLVFGGSSEVQVVNVEVYVTRRGVPVLDLDPEDDTQAPGGALDGAPPGVCFLRPAHQAEAV